MATPITADVLTRAGIPDSLLNRVRQSLRALDLVDTEGNPTEVLTRLAESPEDELQAGLGDWLHATYAEVFQFVNPASDDEIKIRDAFRTYEPRGQQDRMVTLFLGLCDAAGIRTRESTVAAPRPRAIQRQPSARRDAPERTRRVLHKTDAATPEPIVALLTKLPASGRWSKSRRDAFVKTFEAVLDFCYEVSSDVEKGEGDEKEGQ
jgi:hypothetical protein